MFRSMLVGVICLSMISALNAEEKLNSVHDVTMKSLEGKELDFAKEYKGKVLLIVNVASRCGYTPQYEGLQALHDKFSKKGLAVLGVPCNQFGKQEPGSAKEIISFCQKNYGVEFGMTEKVDVNGDKQCDLFKYLTSQETKPKGPGKVNWNFEKYLVSKEGKVIGRYKSGVSPSDLAKEIEKAIGE